MSDSRPRMPHSPISSEEVFEGGHNSIVNEIDEHGQGYKERILDVGGYGLNGKVEDHRARAKTYDRKEPDEEHGEDRSKRPVPPISASTRHPGKTVAIR